MTPTSTWQVTAYGVAGTEFTYEVEAASKREAQEKAYGLHGRRLRDGEVVEQLGSSSTAVHRGAGNGEA